MMRLFTLFTYNVEIQYKSYLLSKAMFFTLLTTGLNILLPFVVAYGSRGFWLKSHNIFEQPAVHFTYDYLLVAETDDPSRPIVCGNEEHDRDEFCAEFWVKEHDHNGDGNNDELELKILLSIPPPIKSVTSIDLILGLDFQLKTVCPLHMQGLAVISKEFSSSPSGFMYYGDLKFYQVTHLPCYANNIDAKYNSSLFTYLKKKKQNVVEDIIEDYFTREVIVNTQTLHSRSRSGNTGAIDILIHLRIPEALILYTPSLLQEFKWAWPQYLSIMVVLYWIFSKIKRFVFSNRLLMAWEVVTWKKLT